MFSQKLIIFVGLALFIAINFTAMTMSNREFLPTNGIERIFISITSPFQMVVTKTIHFTQNIWNTYFMTVLAVKENVELKKQLEKSVEIKNIFVK